MFAYKLSGCDFESLCIQLKQTTQIVDHSQAFTYIGIDLKQIVDHSQAFTYIGIDLKQNDFSITIHQKE